MKEFILVLVTNILTGVNRLIPKKKTRIVLYANLGFRDNVLAFYHYLVRENYQETYDIVCVSNDFYSLEKLAGISYVTPIKGVYYFFTSKYFFYCFGKYPIKPSKEQEVVNLWHGMPLKKIGNLEPHLSNKDFNFFTKIIASSEFFKPIMQEAFKASDDQVLIAGNPRCDDLFKPRYFSERPQKNIVWLPTYRDGKHDTLLFNLTADDWHSLDQVLGDNDIRLYVKLHPLEASLVDFAPYKNIQQIRDADLSSRKISLYQWLGASVALITDYSSVYLDYLLLNRPMAFVTDDINSYSSERGFVFEDILSMMPGEQLKNLGDLVNFVKNISQEIDSHQEERQLLNDKVNQEKKDFSQKIAKLVGLEKNK